MDQSTIDNSFTYHAPHGTQQERYELIRTDAWRFATLLNELCPDSKEKSVAITSLEDAVMWANASIARNE